MAALKAAATGSKESPAHKTKAFWRTIRPGEQTVARQARGDDSILSGRQRWCEGTAAETNFAGGWCVGVFARGHWQTDSKAVFCSLDDASHGSDLSGWL